MKSEKALQRDIVETCRRMYERRFIPATDGNVSVKASNGRILITPAGQNKGGLEENQIIVINSRGEKISGTGTPTFELKMHLCVYREREDVRAVIHAHPPVSTAFSFAGLSLAHYVMPEVVLVLGGIPTAPYAPPFSKRGAEAIRELVRECDALLLDRHGTLTLGRDLNDAYLKLEKVEHCAEVIMLARQLGKVRKLTMKEVTELVDMRRTLGLKGKCYMSGLDKQTL